MQSNDEWASFGRWHYPRYFSTVVCYCLWKARHMLKTASRDFTMLISPWSKCAWKLRVYSAHICTFHNINRVQRKFMNFTPELEPEIFCILTYDMRSWAFGMAWCVKGSGSLNSRWNTIRLCKCCLRFGIVAATTCLANDKVHIPCGSTSHR